MELEHYINNQLIFL